MAKTLSIRFRIDFDSDFNVGPGKIALLEKIQESGSLSAAARLLGMSYRRAWLLLDSLNNTFAEPTTVNTVGGSGGGGAKVTDFGKLLIQRYRQLDGEIRDIGVRCLKDIVPHLAQGTGKPAKFKRAILVKTAQRRGRNA